MQLIRNYIIGVLFALVLALGGVYKLQAMKIEQLKSDVASWEKATTDAAERELNAHRSCEATIEELDKLHQSQKATDKAAGSTLEKLSKVTNPTPRRTVENASNANSVPSTVIELDPDFVRVLNEAYCHGNPADLYCRAEGNDGQAGSVQGK